VKGIVAESVGGVRVAGAVVRGATVVSGVSGGNACRTDIQELIRNLIVSVRYLYPWTPCERSDISLIKDSVASIGHSLWEDKEE
jgi:hypothetical protein